MPKPQVIGSASMILRCPETGYQCTFTQSHNLAGCLVYKLNQCPSYCNGGGIDSCPATFDVNTHFCFLPQNCGHVFPQPEVTTTPFLGKYSCKKNSILKSTPYTLFAKILLFSLPNSSCHRGIDFYPDDGVRIRNVSQKEK